MSNVHESLTTSVHSLAWLDFLRSHCLQVNTKRNEETEKIADETINSALILCQWFELTSFWHSDSMENEAPNAISTNLSRN